ncbi:MAG: SGNH/GDSL hydrolase family protein [Pseudolabrys sp.]
MLSATALIVALFAPGLARADGAARACNIPLDTVRLANPLPHVAQRLGAGHDIVIVAIGSSSTAGAGASSPAANYPSRLAVELGQLFPRQKFTVINRGVNGEEAADMLKRFDTQVVAEKPDLVLWQLGTNSVIRDRPLIDHGATIRDGINTIKPTGADVILIDPQFAPKVIIKPEVEHVVDLIGITAKTENVDLFHRFALMRHWHDDERLTFEDFVSADGLHMNDWSYGCLAKTLAAAIAEAATRPLTSASASSLPKR